MKNSKFNLFASRATINRTACLLTIAITAAMPSAQAVEKVWGGVGSTTTTVTFNSAANWDGGVAPSGSLSGDTVAFGTTGNIAPELNSATRSVLGFTFNAGANAFTFGSTFAGGNVLSIGASGIANSATNTQTFGTAVTVVVGASHTWNTLAGGTLQINGIVDLSNSTTSRNLIIAGAGTTNVSNTIRNSFANTNTLSITSTGTTTLSGNNTYNGTTTMNALGGVLNLSGDNSGADGLVTITAGTVKLGHANALGSTVLGTTVASGAVLDLNGLTIGTEALSLAGTGIASGGALVNTSGTAASHSGAVTLTADTAIGGNITLSGGVSGGTRKLTKTGAGTLVLSGNSSYTGLTTVNGGALTLSGNNSAATGGVTLTAGTLNINNNRALGAGASLSCAASTTINNTSGVAVINAGNQTWTWPSNNTTVTDPQVTPLTNPLTFGTSESTAANNLDLGTGVVTASSSRSIILAGTGTTLTMGPVNITSTGSGRTLTATGAGNTLNMRGLTLSAGAAPVTVVLDGTANLTISGPIVNGSAFANGLEIDRTGLTIFSGTNTYTGPTKISSGTLQIDGPAALASASTLNSGGSASDTSTLNLATASAGYAMDSLSIGGIMRFTGPASGSATLTFAGSATQGFTGASAEKKINVASAMNVVVNGSAFNLLGTTATANRDHAIQVDGSMTFNSVIEATGAAFTAGFSKTGAGVLALNGANTYNGNTFAEAGILRLGNAAAIPGGIAATGGTSALVLSGGAIIGLTPASGDFTRNISAAAFDFDDLAPIPTPALPLPVTDVGWVPGETGGFAAFGGDRSVNFGGAGASVGWSSSNGRFGGGLILGHSTSDSTITLVNPISIGDTNARTITVNDGTKTVDAILGGAVTGGAGSSLVKDGAGTLALNAANTYIGETNVVAGVLALNGTSIVDTNKVTLNGGKVDLTGTETVGSLYFGAAQQVSGTWGASGSGATNIDNTRFSGTGVLNVVPVVLDPYASWVDSPAYNSPPLSSGDKLPTADPDNDGIDNLLEFTLGGNPVVSSQAILPTQATVGPNLVLSYKRSDESESPATTQVGQWTTDLNSWTDVTPVLVNENGTAPDDMTVSVPTSNAVAGHLFVRLKVVK